MSALCFAAFAGGTGACTGGAARSVLLVFGLFKNTEAKMNGVDRTDCCARAAADALGGLRIPDGIHIHFADPRTCSAGDAFVSVHG